MITVAVAAVIGVAIGGTSVWAAVQHRADQADIVLMRVRRENATLRHSNSRLSQHCGHCGIARNLPTPGGHP
jgi:hypothetical protein